MRVHHIGYLVKNMESAIKAFMTLGYDIFQDKIYDKSRKADFVFLKNSDTTVELIAPTKDCQEYKSLSKRIGNAPYHICYVADDFASDCHSLEMAGYLMIKQPAIAPAISGRKVAFFFHEDIGMIELLEP